MPQWKETDNEWATRNLAYVGLQLATLEAHGLVHALEVWEAVNLDGHSVSTNDWPGWALIMDSPPPVRY
jgi:hypothetical protein